METPVDPAAALQRASRRLADDPASAAVEAEAILARSPRDPRAALILASARRRLGDVDGALAVLRPLAAAFPNAALTQFELGATLAAKGDDAAALAALRRAAALAPDNPQTWRALGDLLFRRGENAEAAKAFAEHARASVGDPRLTGAAAALHDGRTAEAEALLRTHLAAAPDDVQALALLGDALARQGRDAEAEAPLQRGLALDPRFDGARFALASALFRQQKLTAAQAHLERLARAYPDEPAYLNLLAATLAGLGDFDRAGALYETLLASHARQPLIWMNYAHALRSIGRSDEAIAAYRRAIVLAPELGEAYLALANLKVAAFSDSETEAMARLAARADLPAGEHAQLCFALGKALEDRGDYAGAFANFSRGSSLRRATTPYDAAAAAEQTRRSIELFTADFFAARGGFGCPAQGPIFVVGLPRSGSTLVEQILASHSAIEGTMELPTLGFIVQDLAPYPDAVARLTAAEARALGERYLAGAAAYRRHDRPFFVDKMPNNYQHVGLIRLILPNARIIDARRHPLATCLSCFKQHFAQGQAFSDDLADLGHVYRDYVELMGAFGRAQPGASLRVIYEDVVDDLESAVRRLLAWLDLPFEPACLRFHETRRAVRTVSSEQVRRPIFREGLDLWLHYAAWLGPLEAALGPALESWRD
jgi:tetratricopeptide (TPR) repeat protein